ncbi:MAG: CBS domain-containing protein [Myxococcales bacterium]|nr:CBS domain-containing protein [Myxococcales bacterium]
MVSNELVDVTIARIPHRRPVLAGRDQPVGELVDRLAASKRGSVIVIDDDGRVLGMFTERDVKHRLDFRDESWREVLVGDVMTVDATAIHESATFADALALMRDRRRRHLPIVGANGRVDGVLSIRDLLRFVVRHYPDHFLNLPPGPKHETSSRWGG